MVDPILDEIWRVREELVRKHGGMEGFWKYIRKLERAHLRRRKRRKLTKAERPKPSPRRSPDSGAPVVVGDPILDEISRVRQELVKKHGGIDGFLNHVERADRERRRRQGRRKRTKTKNAKV